MTKYNNDCMIDIPSLANISLASSDKDFIKELAKFLNQHHRENASNTPDYVLANYLAACLDAFDIGVNIRDLHFSNISPDY